MSGRAIIRCKYVRCESKKGYGGNWVTSYILRDAVDLHGNPIVDIFSFDGIGGIKGKKFKEGDTLQMTVTIGTTKKGAIKLSRPANIVKIEGMV